MKKYFLSIVALAGMLFATSCQESLVEPQVDGTTTFTIEVPGQMGTKATTDVINRLYVEVYSADGSTLVHRPNFYTMADGKATVTLNLVANQEYDIIFWAQNGEAYNTESLKSIKMNELHHNSENGAAFYAVLDNYNPINGKKEVKLTRPFAQLNLWTTNEVDYGSREVTIVKSTIKVENAASEFNRVNDQTFGKGIGSTTYTYVSDVLPQGTKTINNGTKDIVYQYVSMDYLAVPENQALVNITATIVVEDPNGVRSEIVREIRDVPVQLNFKTNIIGNLITSANEFEVSLDENWLGETTKEVEFREVATAEELQEAIQDGVDNITLTEDITLDQPLVFVAPSSQSPIARASTNETSFVLDLNGKNLKGSISVNGVVLIVNNGTIVSEKPEYSGIVSKGDLTLNNVNITSARHALRIESGKAVINGGEYKVEPKAGTSMTVHALNVGDDNTYAEVLIENGTFIGPRGTNGESGSAVQVRNGSKVTIENGVFSGGKNKTLTANQEDLVVKGGEFDQNPAGWVAEGYKAVEAVGAAGGKSYVVLPSNNEYDIVITDPTQLTKGVLDANQNILLQLAAREYTIDLYMSGSSNANLTIVGTEGTKVKFAHDQVRLYLFNNFTIKNCEILHMATKKWGMLVFSSGDKEEGVYTIDNCTFNGVKTQGIYINETVSGAKYNIKNCTFNGDFGTEGAITISTHKDVKHIVNVTGCEFNNVPADHRIFLTPSTAGLFYHFKLNTDLEVATVDELVMFLALGQAQLGCNLTFSANETPNTGYGAAGVIVSNDALLDGQGHTLIVNNAWGTWDCVVAAKGGRIENLTVSGAMRGIFMPGANGHVYIDNVIFDNVIYTFNSDAGNKDYGVYISNSTLNGWTSFSDAHKEVVFTNCTFGEGSGYAFCRPYNACVFENCEFSTDMEFDTSKVANIVFKNCTYGGVKITAENAASLKTGEVTFFYNGVGSVSFE